MTTSEAKQAKPERLGVGGGKASSLNTFTIEPKSAIALTVDFSYKINDAGECAANEPPLDQAISIPNGVVQLILTNRVLAEGGEVELTLAANRTKCVSEAFVAFLDKFKEALNLSAIKVVYSPLGEEGARLQLVLATNDVQSPEVPSSTSETTTTPTLAPSLDSVNVNFTWIEQPTLESSSSVFVWDLATLIQQNPLCFHVHNLLSRCLPRLVRQALLLPSFLRSNFCGEWIQRRKSSLPYIDSISSSIANLTRRCNREQELAEGWIRDVASSLRVTDTQPVVTDILLSSMIKAAMLQIDDFVFNPISMRPKLEQPPCPASKTIDDSDLEDLVREPLLDSDEEGEEQRQFRLELERSPTPFLEVLPCPSQWGRHHQTVGTESISSVELGTTHSSQELLGPGYMESMEILSFPTTTNEGYFDDTDEIEVGPQMQPYAEDVEGNSHPSEILSFPDSPPLKHASISPRAVDETRRQHDGSPTSDSDSLCDVRSPMSKRIKLEEDLDHELILLFDDEAPVAVA